MASEQTIHLKLSDIHDYGHPELPESYRFVGSFEDNILCMSRRVGNIFRDEGVGKEKCWHKPSSLISAQVACLAKIAPEDVAAGLTVIYGFAPRLKLGNENRIGFGFRFGNHADFQILYEFGPQAVTKSPLTVTRPRAVVYRQPVRKTRRRPIIEFLLRTGLLREVERVETRVYSTVRTVDTKVR